MTAADVPLLPVELWQTVLSQLYLPDLVNVSAASRVFQALAADALAEQHAIRRRFHLIWQREDEEARHDFCYNHLMTVLRDPRAAFYIEELSVEYTNMHVEDEEDWSVIPSSEDLELITRAVEDERWIPDEEKKEFLELMLGGDEDAMLTLMILRLLNLTWLSLPTYCWGGLNFEHLMPIVARIAEAAASPDPLEPLPLAKLSHYSGRIFNSRFGVDFESIAPLMALPSLRALRTPYNTEAGFTWPASLPPSRLQRISIPDGRVSRKAIVALAKNIRGPCEIHQVTRRYNDPPRGVKWNVLEIPSEGAAKSEWRIELDGTLEEDGEEEWMPT